MNIEDTLYFGLLNHLQEYMHTALVFLVTFVLINSIVGMVLVVLDFNKNTLIKQTHKTNIYRLYS